MQTPALRLTLRCRPAPPLGRNTQLALRRSVQRAGGLLFAEHRTRCRARLPGVHAPGTLSSIVTSARCTRRPQERKADEVAVAVIDAALPVLSAEDVPAREIHMHIRTQARAVAAHIRAPALTQARGCLLSLLLGERQTVDQETCLARLVHSLGHLQGCSAQRAYTSWRMPRAPARLEQRAHRMMPRRCSRWHDAGRARACRARRRRR